MFRVQLRTGSGRIGGVFAALSIVLHLTLRGTGWRYEWLWALTQYAFVTIFLGPLAAGIAAWEGATWSASQLPTARPDRHARVMAVSLGAVLAWILVPYLVGLVAVAAVVHGVGTPGLPTARESVTILPPIALLVGWAALGYCFGWAVRSRSLAAPVAAVASFAFTLIAYAGIPGHVVDVGAVTSSLVGLRSRASVSLDQLAFWVSVAALSASIVALRAYRVLVVLAVVPLLTGAIAYGSGVAAGGDRLTAAPGDGVVCRGRPAVCLAPSYERFRPDVEAALRPDLDVLAAAGAPLPRLLTQNGADSGARLGNGYLSVRAVRGDRAQAGLAVLNAYLPPSCPFGLRPAAEAAFRQLQDLLVAPTPAAALAPATTLRGAPPARVRAAVATLARCR